MLVIDQLEEIFTLATLDERRAFISVFVSLRPEIWLTLVVRADFWGALMESELWPLVRRAHRLEIDPMRGGRRFARRSRSPRAAAPEDGGRPHDGYVGPTGTEVPLNADPPATPRGMR